MILKTLCRMVVLLDASLFLGYAAPGGRMASPIRGNRRVVADLFGRAGV
jgi:hypothetical protein